MIRIGSLFTGYGGLDMAAQAVVGGNVVWHCDIKPASVALLAHRFPGVPNLGDLTAVDWSAVAPVDLLTFGWPCQPHSSAGKRLGEADPRALWPYVARAVQALRPGILLGENVARVATNGELRRVVQALAALGYVGAWQCLAASDIGAPHKRDRLALVAVDAATHALGVQLRDEPGWGGRTGGSGAGVAGHDGAAGSARLTLLPTPNATDGQGGVRALPERRTHGGKDHGPRLCDVAPTLLPTPTVSDARNGRNATAGRNNPDSAHHSGWTLSDVAHASRWGVYAAAIERWERTFGRPAPEPTMLSARTGNPQLAPPFVEWMMGLPAGWVTDVPGLVPRPSGERNAMLSLLGDGVVPQQLAEGFRRGLVALELRAAS